MSGNNVSGSLTKPWWGLVLVVAVALAACADSGSGEGTDTVDSTTSVDEQPETEPVPGTGHARFETFQDASLVIGQPDFASKQSNQGGGVGAGTLSFPAQATMYNGRVYVGDSSNDRILVFDELPVTNESEADIAIGQSLLTTNAGGSTATATQSPLAAHEDSEGRLLIADRGNGRVLIFDSAPDTSGAAAQIAVGQDGFSQYAPTCDAGSLSAADDVSVAGGKLLVADSSRHRVLIWNSIPEAHGTAADLVLGQPSLDSCSQNQDGDPAADTLSLPIGVWSDGTRVVVADNNNHRLLIWTSFPTQTGQPADIVLGQDDFASAIDTEPDANTLSFPQRITSDGSQLFVADAGNNRVLIWETFPTANGQPADRVLGQNSFTRGEANDANQDGASESSPSAATLNAPTGVFLAEGVLLVADQLNHRVLVFEGN